MSLPYIGQQIAIYFGFFLIVSGVFGNGINIFIFLSTRNYRATPCTFYFLIASIFNIIYITMNLTTRIIATGFGIDWTRTSASWCKLRQFSLFTVGLITMTFTCLATIDQFFVTSQSVRLRRLSNIKWTYRIVIIVIIIGFLQQVPFVVTQDIPPTTRICTNSNPAYAIFMPVYVVGLICGIPVIVMVIFGYLGYRNIKLKIVLAEQRADRQLTRSILIQVALAIICFVPYGTNNVYSLLTANVIKDSNRLVNESFASTIISLLFFCYFTGSGYIFMISSSRFRRTVKDWILFCLRRNRIAAVEQGNIRTTTMNNGTNH